MIKVLQVGNRIIKADEIIPLLAGYQLLPQLLREVLIDQAITSIKCTSEETAIACQQFYELHQLTTETERQALLAGYGMSPEQLEVLATRRLRIEKFKQETWGHKLEA